MEKQKKSVPFLSTAFFSCLGGTAIMWLIFVLASLAGIVGDGATFFILFAFVPSLLPAIVYAKFSGRFETGEFKSAGALVHIIVWALMNALLIIPTVAIYGLLVKNDGSFIPDITPLVLPVLFCITSVILAAVFTAIAKRAKMESTTEVR
ncbi:MAG: hypothetical protein II722_07200 [Ruminococcus sp.]|nr:hypothetical protein [Ruminococcus sp.]